MKKKSLIALVCAIAMGGFVFSACSSDTEDDTKYATSYLACPDRVYIYSDFLREAKDETATLHYEAWSNIWYLLDKDENRYYIFTYTDESNDTFRTLMEKGVIVDGASVKFDGQVYGTADVFREVGVNYLDRLEKEPDVVRDHQWILPLKSDWLQANSKDKAFVLMIPFTIELAE